MPPVKCTTHLQRFFPGLGDNVTVKGRTVAEVVAALDDRFPGLGDYLVDERGALRKHVNIFVSGSLVHDRDGLTDSVDDTTQVYIFQALSGG